MINIIDSNNKSNFQKSKKPIYIKQIIRAYLFEKTAQKIPKDKKVLDLCCGYGFYFMINNNAYGIDRDFSCALFLKEHGKVIPLANILDPLPFKTGIFSYVLSHDVFEHFSIVELKNIMPEVHRILCADGKLIILVPNKKGFEYGLKNHIGHKTYITKDEINYLIPGYFKIISYYLEPFPSFLGKCYTHNKQIFILQKN